MGRKGWLFVGLLVCLMVNIVMLQWTIEHYMTYDYTMMRLYSGIAFVNTIIVVVLYRLWSRSAA